MRRAGSPRLRAIAGLLLLLPACAAGVRRLELPLPADPRPSPSASPRLAIGRVEDGRRFARLVEHRDRSGKLRWRGEAKQPVEQWLRESTARLLRTRGIAVVTDPDEAQWKLDLRLREALVDTRRSRRRSEVALLAWIRCARDDRVLALAPLRGRARQERTSETSDGGTLLLALDRALDDLLPKLASCPTCSAEAGK